MSVPEAGGYAGDTTPTRAWELLSSDDRSALVDVRTRAEWSFVGLPSLKAIGKEPLTLEWQTFPAMVENLDFVERLSAGLREAGLDENAPIFFLCRSGVRSRHAAIAMTGAGWTRCHNVSGGFEGPLDAAGHRGTVAGWKAEGLPWTQS